MAFVEFKYSPGTCWCRIGTDIESVSIHADDLYLLIAELVNFQDKYKKQEEIDHEIKKAHAYKNELKSL